MKRSTSFWVWVCPICRATSRKAIKCTPCRRYGNKHMDKNHGHHEGLIMIKKSESTIVLPRNKVKHIPNTNGRLTKIFEAIESCDTDMYWTNREGWLVKHGYKCEKKLAVV